jgi:hypothetical protein
LIAISAPGLEDPFLGLIRLRTVDQTFLSVRVRSVTQWREESAMDLSALLLSRLQFAFTVSFHIVFPSFTIGLAAWLTTIEALHLATGRPAYRIVFEFWLKIFGIAFGLGVVSGIVMAFQFGTNWSELSRASGPIQGPLDLAQINGAGDPVQRIAPPAWSWRRRWRKWRRSLCADSSEGSTRPEARSS